MTTLSRRSRRSSEDEPEERSTRRRGGRRREGYNPADDESAMAGGDNGRERPRSRRRRDDDEDDKPSRTRGRGSSRRRDDDEDNKPSRSRGRSGGRSSGRRKPSGGFGSYQSKRQERSEFKDNKFVPESDEPTLIKILDEEPFDVYFQHWVDEGDARGKTRHSFMCRDDADFFEDTDCPLCAVGVNTDTKALFNVLDLSNPNKPEVKVWVTSVTIADILQRMAESDRTSPLNREDLYFEVIVTKKKNKTSYEINPVKARDLAEDFDIDPFTEEELAEFEEDLFEDRTAVIQEDSYDDLDDLAASLD